MRIRTILAALVIAGAASVTTYGRAWADDDDDDAKPKNLKVLQDNGKAFQGGMKAMSKGLGVKCTACHVKGDYDDDKNNEKLEARKFFDKVVGEKDQAKRGAALKELLATLKLKAAKHPADVWKGVDMLKKK